MSFHIGKIISSYLRDVSNEPNDVTAQRQRKTHHDQATTQINEKSKFFRGARTAERLRSMFRSGNKPPAGKSASFGMTQNALQQAKNESPTVLSIAASKLNRDFPLIQLEMEKWTAYENANLSATLKKFNQPKPAGQLALGQKNIDGLRSGVTAFLQGMTGLLSDTSPALKQRAKQLNDAVIFETHDGTKFRLKDFGTPGVHGLGGIDSLNLSASERRMLADRFLTALDDLDHLAAMYTANATEAPPLKLDLTATLTMGSAANEKIARSEPEPHGSVTLPSNKNKPLPDIPKPLPKIPGAG